METVVRKNRTRESFKNFCAPFFELKRNGEIESINSALVSVYAQQGKTNLKTFNQWKAEGRSIAKGAKAVYLWSSYRRTVTGLEGEQKEVTFIPLVALFAENQTYTVEKLNKLNPDYSEYQEYQDYKERA